MSIMNGSTGESKNRFEKDLQPVEQFKYANRFSNDPSQCEKFIGNSPAFNSIMQTIKAVASRKCSIIITGRTGVGKEMVARQIHLQSTRANKVFVPVDCTTLTGQLFESQLFGHKKGAFTGAVDNTLGFFRAASGGTIFLDEISEIPIDLQAKLLRVLQQQAVTPLGSTKAYPIDVRVISATNRDLAQLVKDEKFRPDLYYRLNVVNITVPPLKDRKEDIIPLAEHFLKNQADFYDENPKKLADEVIKIFLNYNWPGNVRELANAVERAYVLSTSNLITTAVLPFEMLLDQAPEYPKHELPTLDQAKRILITKTLEHTHGRKIAAAKILGIERRKLNRLIERLNIQASDYKKT
jgi:transcriptional regulator with PAS, ATPase and Fis domain